MNSTIALYLKKNVLTLLFLSLSISLFAQSNTTYKVVCDKTNSDIKIVKSTNHSANYVPLKGGFPFRQIAEKWILENHPTRKCSAEGQDTPSNIDNISPTTTTTVASQSSSPSPTNKSTTIPPKINYRNSTLFFHGKFSNLGEAFSLSNENMNGFEVGFEQLFGAKSYFGTGISANFFFSDMEEWQGVDSETIRFFRIPVFGGYRIQKRMFVAMFEAGGALNTKFKGTDNDLEAYGLEPKSISTNLMLRAKVGFPGIMFEAGYDTWIGDVFEGQNFNLSAFRVGIRVSF